MQSASEGASIERAETANAAIVAVFHRLSKSSGNVLPSERLYLSGAEQAVLEPLQQLSARNRREYVTAGAAARSSEAAGFHTVLGACLLGLVAIASFGIFAFRLVRRIESQNVALRSADREKDEFIGLVSHEFRTPLTSINGFVELLLDEAGASLSDEHRTYLATVQRGSMRLDRLVNDLLLTAQLRGAPLDLQMTNTDAVEVARVAVESAQAHAGSAAIRLCLSAPPHAIEIDADPIRLAQAFDNLISNAIKFTPGGGRVDVAVAQGDDRATLTVADSGMGMTAAEIARLFEPFFRTESAKRIQGTGLGLPIVKSIVEGHHGTISITSKPKVGTSFAISLPLAHPLGSRVRSEGA